MDVICLGILTCDVLVQHVPERLPKRDTTVVERISLAAGGDALNVAVNLSRMGFSTGIVGKIGRDGYGRFLQEILQKEKVNADGLLQEEAEQTSVSVVLISESGERSFLFAPGATGRLSYEDVAKEFPEGVRVLDIGSWFALPGFSTEGMENLLKRAKERGILTVMDVTNNPGPPDLPALKQLLPWIDYFIPSREEAESLSGLSEPEQIASFFLEMGARTVIVKLGEKGAAGTDGSKMEYVPATGDRPVDTTGAGDCFVAGIIAAVLKGFSLRRAMEFACKAAGLSITAVGATTATRDFDTIDRRHPEYGEIKGGEDAVESDYHNL